MQGTVLNIQRFCTADGPGIRTTVFFKGCPLHCVWCHNPETQRTSVELLYNAAQCVGCGRCAASCPKGCHTVSEKGHFFDRTACVACGTCVSAACGALELAGRTMSVDQVMAEVLKDKAFYDNSGGGLTLSGGEPLLQSEFCLELMQRAKENGLHVCIETCGVADATVLRRTAEWVDLYLFDIKETDPQRHRRYTGADNRHILENLRLLDGLGKHTVLRCPIIPTLNDRASHFRGIAALANSMQHLCQIVIEPYHDLGVSKYTRLSREYTLPAVKPPDAQTVEQWIKEIQKHTAVAVRRE